MASIFVGKDERVSVSVYAWEDGDVLYADCNPPPKQQSVNEYKFVFRRLTHKDSNLLWATARSISMAGESALVVVLRDTILRMFLVDWEIIEHGQPVQYDATKVDSLAPPVARAAAEAYMSKVQIS